MKKTVLITITLFVTLNFFSQDKINFNVFLNNFPELELPVSSEYFKSYTSSNIDTMLIMKFIDSEIKYYTIHNDFETGKITFEGYIYYEYRGLGKITSAKNTWVLYSKTGNEEFKNKYLISFDNSGNIIDKMLIGYNIVDSIYSRFIIDENQVLKIFYYEPFNNSYKESQIIIKTFNLKNQENFELYQTDTLITNHNYYDYFWKKIDDDPFYFNRK